MDFIKKQLKSSLFTFFLFLVKRKKYQSKIHSSQPLNILLIHFGTIQQALSVTPLLTVLSKKLKCSISVLQNQQNTHVFNNNEFVNLSLIFKNEPRAILNTLRKLYSYKFDVVINTHEDINQNASLITGLLRVRYKIGFIKNDYKLYTHALDIKDQNKVHLIDRILDITDAFEIYFSKSDLNVHYLPSSNATMIVENFIIKHDLNYKMTVLINLTGNDGIGYWGTDKYKKLIKYLGNYNINVILTASIEDIDEAELIGKDKYLIFYDTEFDIFSELVRNVDFIFSPDSYVVQLASAFKIPIFCLFVQHKSNEMINVPYNSDFDFALTEKNNFRDISYGKVLNSFIPYFDYIYENYKTKT